MNACAQEILILTGTEHASTTSPVKETQKYDCEDQDKGTDQVGTSWMLGEELKATKCVRRIHVLADCMENS